jgi:hypothetical protein
LKEGKIMVVFAPLDIVEQERSVPEPDDLPTKIAVLEASIDTAHSHVSRLQDDHATSVQRTTTAESKIVELNTWIKVGGSVATLVILSGLGFLTTQVNSISKDVSGLKQAEKDRDVQIVKQIAAPTNPTLFHEAVANATHSIQQAAIEKRPPSPVKVEALSDALAKATSQSDVSPDTWRLASEFISYRSDAKVGFASQTLPQCSHLKPEKSAKPSAPSLILSASNCVLNLNDLDSLAEKPVATVRAVSVPKLYLKGVELKYRDSSDKPETAAFDGIVCVSCRYNFETTQAPPDPVKGIIKSLVLADSKRLEVKPQS